jgi:hypothetical protein
VIDCSNLVQMRRGLLAVLICLPTWGQAQEKPFKLHSTWQTGDRVQYNIKTSVVVQRAAATPVSQIGESLASVRVLESKEGGSIHEWRIEQKTLPGQLSTVGEKLSQHFRSLPLQLQLDQLASIVGIANSAEAKAALVPALQALVKEKSDSLEQKEGLRRMMESIFSEDRQLALFFTREAQLVYSPIGGEYEFSSLRHGQTNTVTPFSSEPFLSDVEITVSPLNQEKRTYEITFTETLNPKDVARFVDGLISQMSKAAGSTAPSMKDFNIQLRRASVYEMDFNSSWPRSIKWKQTAVSGSSQRQDDIEMTRQR